MRTIAFVTQKGGSGKSTLASCVAVAAREAGEKVFLIEMDALGSLTKWAAARGETDIPVEAVPAGKLRQVLSALEKKGFTLAVIDTPGAEHDSLNAAVKAADLSIIPARPNAFDLWASEKTRSAIKNFGREFAFLLNQCPPAQQSARVELGAKALEAMGGLLTPLVQARVDYQEASRSGLGVTEYSPYGAAAEEIRGLWGSIRRRLNKIANARKSAARSDAAEAVKSPSKTTAKREAEILKAGAETKAAQDGKPLQESKPSQEAKAKPQPEAKPQVVARTEAKADGNEANGLTAVEAKAASGKAQPLKKPAKAEVEAKGAPTASVKAPLQQAAAERTAPPARQTAKVATPEKPAQKTARSSKAA